VKSREITIPLSYARPKVRTSLQKKLVTGSVDVSTSVSQICHSCHSTSAVFDALTGEIVCTHCGTVLSDRPLVLADTKSKDRAGISSSLAYPDKGLSTVITNSNTDVYGTCLNQQQITNVKRIRYLDKLSSSSAHTRNLKNALVVMASTKDKLGLADPVMERAAYYYRKSLYNKLIKGRSIKEMVVASICVACKEMGVPRTLYELCTAANADPVFAGRCFRMMTWELNITPSVVDATLYISRVASNANINQRVYRTAVDMLDIVKKDACSFGKEPKALASAVLYAACLMERQNDISQARIAKAGGISVVTLRKRLSDVSRLFPEIRTEISDPKIRHSGSRCT
jgi:transcription initiation factor TFIIB